MRYDDPARPKHGDATSTPLQVNGSPLPTIILIRPMTSETDVQWTCMGDAVHGECAKHPGADCPNCKRSSCDVIGWLAGIHAHREGARFGYHTGFIASLDEFHRAYLEDPEAALAKWFKYEGPERVAPSSAKKSVGTVVDIFGGE